MQPTILYFVRHGETDWNIAHRFQGSSNVALNAAGIDQAQKLKHRLKDETFDAVYSSDLQRAADTADAITTLPIQHDARLQEIHFGHFEGLTFQQIEEKYPVELAAWRKQEAPPPDGETMSAVAQRLQSFLDDIRAQHAQKRVLIVSHGAAIAVAICLLIDYPPENVWRFRLGNTSISEVNIFKRGPVLVRLNDTCHLA